MAIVYATGTATDQQDLLSQLDTYLQANGWTEDEWSVGNKRLCVHKDTVYVQFRWDAVAATGCIGVYHSLGYAGGSAPGAHPNDSGNGQTTANPITTCRRIEALGNGAFTNFFIFGDSAIPYCHVVIEVTAGVFRHMSFGLITKVGTWVGGEYCSVLDWYYSGVNQSNISYSSHSALFDANNTSATNTETGTIHMEGMQNEGGTSKWGNILNAAPASLGLDRAGFTRYCVMGGMREGPLNNVLCAMAANPSNGFVAMHPIWLTYRDRSVTPENHFFLGTVPGIRFINIMYLDPAEEFVVGSDTWKVFPWVKKQNLGGSNPESKNMGIAYQKA